jgi:glutamate-1-semialdehyde 2,1-aminomutase
MDMVAPAGSVYQAGTLSGNPLSMAAGLAALRLLNRPGAYERLELMGRRLGEGLGAAAKAAEASVVVQRIGSMLTAFFVDGQVFDFESARRSDTKAFAAFFHSMLGSGVYLPPSQFEAMFVSLAHTEDDLAQIVEAAQRSFERAPE